jgi:hypothetical protein
MAYVETNGVRIREKKRRWRITTLVSVLSLIAAIVFGINSVIINRQNQELINQLYNYPPFIYSNYSTSILNSQFYIRGNTLVHFQGMVKVDLTVITPHVGMLRIEVKSFNFSFDNTMANNVLDLDLLNKSSVSYVGRTTYEYLVEQGRNPPIVENMLITADVYVKPENIATPPVTTIGFPIGELIFEAKIFDAQTGKTITSEFAEGIEVYIKPII